MSAAFQSYPQFGWGDPYAVGLGALGVSQATKTGITSGLISGGMSIATDAIGLFLSSSKQRGAEKIGATNIANQVAYQMQRNLAAYMAGPHTVSDQAQALANFEALFNYMIGPDGCGNPGLYHAGQACISERMPGGIYDMAKDNRNPIASDPEVKPDPVLGSAGELIDSVTGELLGTGASSSWLLLGGAALLLVAAFAFGGGK